jgi:ankyrin repeat protein
LTITSPSVRLYASRDTGALQPVFDYLAEGGDPNLRPKPRGRTLLHAAAFKDRRSVVEALIARGADIDALCDGDAFTPLVDAAHKGHVGCLRVLLAAGASLTCRPLGLSLMDSLRYAQVKSDRVVQVLADASSAAPGEDG